MSVEKKWTMEKYQKSENETFWVKTETNIKQNEIYIYIYIYMHVLLFVLVFLEEIEKASWDLKTNSNPNGPPKSGFESNPFSFCSWPREREEGGEERVRRQVTQDQGSLCNTTSQNEGLHQMT